MGLGWFLFVSLLTCIEAVAALPHSNQNLEHIVSPSLRTIKKDYSFSPGKFGVDTGVHVDNKRPSPEQEIKHLEIPLHQFEDKIGYFIELEVGTPRKLQRMVLDTGSSYTLLVGKGCQLEGKKEICPQKDTPFHHANSSSSEIVQCSSPICSLLQNSACKLLHDTGSPCRVDVKYLDGAKANSILVYDKVSLAANFTSYIHFGEVYQQDGGFTTIVDDGLIGLAFSSLSSNIPTLADNVIRQNFLNDSFSMCFGNRNEGKVVWGGDNGSYYEGEIEYVPMVEHDQFYQVACSVISVSWNSNSIPDTEDPSTIVEEMKISAPSRIIIDTGSTVSHMGEPHYSSLLKALCPSKHANGHPLLCGKNNLMNLPAGHCLKIQHSQLSTLPTLTLQLPGSDSNSSVFLSFDGEDYVHFVPKYGGYICATFGIEDLKYPDKMIMGVNLLRKYYVKFDRASKRMGFAESTCRIAVDYGSFTLSLFALYCMIVLWVVVTLDFLVSFCRSKGDYSGPDDDLKLLHSEKTQEV